MVQWCTYHSTSTEGILGTSHRLSDCQRLFDRQGKLAVSFGACEPGPWCHGRMYTPCLHAAVGQHVLHVPLRQPLDQPALHDAKGRACTHLNQVQLWSAIQTRRHL